MTLLSAPSPLPCFARLAPEWTCQTELCHFFASMSYEGSTSQHALEAHDGWTAALGFMLQPHSTTWVLKGLVPRGRVIWWLLPLWVPAHCHGQG